MSRVSLGAHPSQIDIVRNRIPSARNLTQYDPRDHRTPLHTIQLWMAYFNLLRTMFGAGMLGMPLVISQMGIVLGPMLTLATGILIITTHNLLLTSLYEVGRQLRIPYVSYRYGFRIALLSGPPLLHWVGKRGPTIIAMFMVTSQLGICSVFVIFTTDCLRDIMDWDSSRPALAALYIPYLAMEYFMKDLSIISYISSSGVVLNMVGLIIVFEHMFLDNNGETISAKTSIEAILFGFGILLFNLNNVGVILSLDKSLVDPRQITAKCGVLNVGIMIPTIVGIIFGSLGYYAFGTMEENVLRGLPYDEASSMVAIGLYLLAVAFAYPIQCYPAIQTITEVVKYHDELTPPSEKTIKLLEAFARPLFVTLSFIISYFVPFQGPLIAFVGNLCTTMTQLVFPAIMDIGLRYPDDFGHKNCRLYRDLFLIGLGLTSFVFGVYHSAYLIHIRILSQHSPNNSGFF